MELKLLDVVVLTKNFPEQHLPKGAIGTIVEKLKAGLFLVEFADKHGVTYAMTDLPASVLMKVVREPSIEGV